MVENGPSIVSIGSLGRSGTTLLMRLLGTLDGFLPVGELTTIWAHYCRGNPMCGCGNAFKDCEFWGPVMDEAFGGIDQVDAAHMIALQRRTHRRYLPMLLYPRLRSPSYARDIAEYAAVHETLYRAIQKVSGCRVIIDSSKRPGHALALSDRPTIRPKLIALVRDSRACAYSRQRKKRRIEVTDRVEYMPQYSVVRSAVDWNLRQIDLPLAKHRFAMYAEYRYEDLVTSPRRVLTDMAERLGEREPAFPFVSDHTIELGSDHSLWGNPSRFESGIITIRADEEWRTEMATTKRMAVTALTLPWLWSHGYAKTDELASALLSISPKPGGRA